jgi:hypothetical protein
MPPHSPLADRSVLSRQGNGCAGFVARQTAIHHPGLVNPATAAGNLVHVPRLPS